MPARIKVRRGSASDWKLANPVLFAGEPGLELDTRKLKFGDGETAWNDINYSSGAAEALAGLRVYVNVDSGNDTNDGVTNPVKTIKRGLQIASDMVYRPASPIESIEEQTSLLRSNADFIAEETILYINETYPTFVYNEDTCKRDVKEIIDSAIYDLRFGGNSRSVTAAEFYYDNQGNSVITGQTTETVAAINYLNTLAQLVMANGVVQPRGTELEQIFDETVTIDPNNATQLAVKISIVSNILTNGLVAAPAKVYGTFKLTEITVNVSTGDYSEDNPVIVPDNVSVVGENLRRTIIRPLNANKDMFRVRNNSYITGVVFRDKLNVNGVPSSTFRYAISFDDTNDTETSRAGYTNLPARKVKIFTSPYIQNCSVISFLGAGGVEIDGNLVDTPNIPPNNIESENPVVVLDGIPEQGKSMVANAFTILSFGGNAWRVINDAYAQIVSCFVIFTENGCIAQNGGYLSITNSASNFGLFALRASGYSPTAFEFDRGIIAGNGISTAFQTLKIIGLKRPPVEHFVVRVRNTINQDITDNFNSDSSLGGEASLTPSGANVGGNVITFATDHGFESGDVIEYDANGNTEIVGLLSEMTYYIDVPSSATIALYHDQARTKSVRTLNATFTTGTHYFRSNYEEFYINEVVDYHDFYQSLILPAGTYTITPGAAITGNNGSATVNAIVHSFDIGTLTLVVSIELVTVGLTTTRNFFTPGSTIDAGVISVSATTVQTATTKTGLLTSNIALISNKSRPMQNIGLTTLNNVWLHRPSVVNSSSHTWEYAGSGTDYNALPQNGGQTDEFFEQVSTLPGRVYTSGTNELGDFKVGDFVRAFNRTGNIEFTNKVTIGQLDSLALSLSSGIVVDSISADIDLGDNEVNGPLDSRLSTQLAVRSFIENRLGNFIGQNLSTNAVPSAVVQLNSQGQINSDLIPPSSGTASYILDEFNKRLTLHEESPPTNLRSGDIVIEEYTELSLTVTGNITVSQGDIIVQQVTNASGKVKETSADNTIKLITPLSGTFNTTNQLNKNGTPLGANSVPVTVDGPTTTTNNYFLRQANKSQYLVINPLENYDFTDAINDETPIIGASSSAVGIPTEYRQGVISTLNVTNFDGGNGYLTAGTYVRVELTSVTGVGSNAEADIVINAGGTVESIDLRRGGIDYALGDILSASALDIGGLGPTGSAFEIAVTAVENRLYVDIEPTVGITFNSNSSNPDYIVHDNSPSFTFLQTGTSQRAFNAASIDVSGNVDYSNERIVFPSPPHTYSDGDPVEYSSAGNTAIGGVTNGSTYYVKVISSTTIELYTTYSLTSRVNFLTSSTGSHELTIKNVNTSKDTFYKTEHGLVTGEAVKYTASATPVGGLTNNAFYYVGSLTVNSFTLHSSRGSALDSINGNTISAINLSSIGSGTTTIEIQNVEVVGNINTSGALTSSWSSLNTQNIDAENIISGIVDSSRLATGSASNLTFLRGDSSWARAVQGLTSTTAGNPITFTGVSFNDGTKNIYYGEVDIKVETASSPSAGTETLGVAAFDYNYFSVDEDGKVEVRTSGDGGIVDAASLGGQNAGYYANPENLSRAVPIEKGGTNVTSFAAGDILYAGTTLGNGTFTDQLSKLTIGAENNILTVNAAGLPQWSGSITVSASTISNVLIGGVDGSTISTTTGDLTLTANTQNVSVTGNLSVSGNLTYAQSSIGTAQITTTSVNQVILESFDISEFTSGKFLIEASSGTERHITELIVATNATTAIATEYGTLITNTSLFLANVDIEIISGAQPTTFCRIRVTPTTVNSTIFKTVYTLIAAS
jgi:hypothetical protein